jgi:hypothetical protein
VRAKDLLIAVAVIIGAIVGGIALIAAVFTGLVFHGLSKPCASPAMRPLVDVEIEMKEEAKPNEPVDVVVSVTPCRPPDGPTEAWLMLPPSATFLDGDLEWKGMLKEEETARFEATIAFIKDGDSTVEAGAAYPYLDLMDGTARGGGSARIAVHSPGQIVFSHQPSHRHLLRGDMLLNQETRPRAFLIYDESGLTALREMGLIPEEPSGGWTLSHNSVMTTLFEQGPLLALYDRIRPTTGYALSILNVEPHADTGKYVLDIIATSPSPRWRVEQRETSPVEIRQLPRLVYGQWGDRLLERIVFRVNRQDVAEYEVEWANRPSLQELTLPPIAPEGIP